MVITFDHRPTLPSSLTYGAEYATCKLSLAFLGYVDYFTIPPTRRFPQMFDHQRTRQYSGSVIAPKYNLCNPGHYCQLFYRNLESLWQCWELMVTGEPILVIGDSPKACSQFVWSLVEIIKPIPFGGDFRPYFTIQDGDLKGLASSGRVTHLLKLAPCSSNSFRSYEHCF